LKSVKDDLGYLAHVAQINGEIDTDFCHVGKNLPTIYGPEYINLSSPSHLLQHPRIVFSVCYPKMHIDIDFDLIVLHRFTFVISIVMNCKSYAFVIALLRNTCAL